MTKIYGIKNCDTMKKTFQWLDDQGIDYDFHDYKKLGADEDVLKSAIDQHGWEKVINQRGTTWRKLDDDIKNSMNAAKAIEVAVDYPSIIKRPLLAHNDNIHLGFDADNYTIIFN
ncbi:MAG: ArsC family reductase [Pseudomonadota bacterium]